MSVGSGASSSSTSVIHAAWVHSTAFLSSLAMRGVAASTQNQALSSLLFLYEVVFGERLGWLNDVVRAGEPAPDRPSIFTAFQERLGLRLEALNAPVSVLVIERVDHPDPD